jgi:hypothetical protein
MKTKRFDKKLRLNKTTLVDLNRSEMRRLNGAQNFTDIGWETWNTYDKRCYINSCVHCTWRPICGPTTD